ncbi:hypothetical protein C2E23DRAFT_740120 [Lenzites betulinus]|nr:hypothetical protein C2E23DRAFT_740120 [Lenzites betulinus]
MSRILEEENRNEFPFPPMDAYRSDSPSSGSLPSRTHSRTETTQTRSLRSSASSGSPVPHARAPRDHDSLHSGAPSKLFSRLMSREYQDTRSLRTIIAVTTERLESETRRADDAERRLLEVLRKLRAAHEATMLAQADAARAKEELTLYKYRLDDAQREISRAQEIINELEQEKQEAEAEAARARSTARRYREQQLMAHAREEGRQQGFEEGFSRGQNMGYQEAVEDGGDQRVEDSRYQKRPVLVEEVEDEESEVAPSRYRAGTPAPDLRSRTPASDVRSRTPASVPRAQTPGPSRRPPSRMTMSRESRRDPPHVSDTAHFAPILPVPTFATPLNMPSPSHSRAGTPAHMPLPSSRPINDGDVPEPIPIHGPVPSPMHPPVNMPPDGWIPYEDANGEISIPPPHELSRPVTPRSPSPALPAPPPPHIISSEPAPRSRNYIYANPPAQQNVPFAGHSSMTVDRPFSPQSKASTTISQFPLVAARGTSRDAKAREDVRLPTSPRGPRPREDLPMRPDMGERQETGETSASGEQNASPTTPLERVFKRRYRRAGPSKETVIPDIIVEEPSTPSTDRSSAKSQITHPHLLSPDLSARPLPAPDSPNVVVMRMEIPGYHPTVPLYKPPYIDDDDASPVIPPLPEGQFPPGFVPLSPPVAGSSDTPLPIPSDDPLPIPSNNPLPVPSRSPLPIPQRGPLPIPNRSPIPIPQNNPLPVPSPSNSGSLYVPQRNPLPVPHKDPVPIPHNDYVPIPPPAEPLPVPHRSGSRAHTYGMRSASPRYDEAPVPTGMMYPSPPSRRSGSGSRTSSVLSPPSRTSVLSPPGSRRGRRDLRSPPGSRLSPLPLNIFAPLRSETNASVD